MLSEVFETGPVAADDEVKGEVSEGDVRPIWVRTDRWKEFTNRSFQNMLKREGIQFQIWKKPRYQMLIFEKAHRTIRDKLFKYFTLKNTQIYRRTPEICRTLQRDCSRYDVHSARTSDGKRCPCHMEKDKQKRSRIPVAQPKFPVGQHARISKDEICQGRGAKLHNRYSEL